jgi:integrase
MASVREYSGKLFCDFRYQGKRCREYTALEDTKANRQKLKKLLEKIEAEIKEGDFEYQKYFPNSKIAKSISKLTGSITVADTQNIAPVVELH